MNVGSENSTESALPLRWVGPTHEQGFRIISITKSLHYILVTSSDLKLSFKKAQTEHCWTPKGANFADGKELTAPDGYSTCCSIGTFQFKSDKTLWMKESGSRQLWCVYVDGISNVKEISDLDNKLVKINSAVNPGKCCNNAVIYFNHVHVLFALLF